MRRVRFGVAVVLAICVISLAGCFRSAAPGGSLAAPTAIPAAIHSVEVARGSVGPQAVKIIEPQGAEVSFPAGALGEPATLTMHQLTGKPPGIAAASAIPAGNGYEIRLSGGAQPSIPVEIRLPIKISSGVDPTRYSVYASQDGNTWVDLGGVVEGDKIRTWASHFTTFWPAQVPAPLRVIAFVNMGWYDARIWVETYTPDPGYVPGAAFGGMAFSGAPTSSGSPSATRYLMLPVGRYTFCYDWNYDASGRRGYAVTGLYGLADSDPIGDWDARWVVITPGREAKWYEGECAAAGRFRAPTTPFARTATPSLTPTFTPTHTPSVTTSPTKTFTPSANPSFTRTRTRTPTITMTASPRVDYRPYQDAFLKRIEDLRRQFQERNCTPTYSGCWEDIFGMPTSIRIGLYTDHWVNVHPSYLTFAQSLEDQLLAALRPCFQQFLDNKAKKMNLDVAKGEQTKCIMNSVLAMYDKESARICETSCRAGCGEQGKAGVVLVSPRRCVCQ